MVKKSVSDSFSDVRNKEIALPHLMHIFLWEDHITNILAINNRTFLEISF